MTGEKTRLLIDRLFYENTNAVMRQELIERLTEAKKQIDERLEYLTKGILRKNAYLRLNNHELETPFETNWENWIEIIHGDEPIIYRVRDWHPEKTETVQEDYEVIIKFPPLILKEGKHLGYPRKYTGVQGT